MTIAVGINLGKYVFLASDTRTTYYLGSKIIVHDDSQKIQKTGIGLITGAGFVPLLDSVKERLAKEVIKNTNDIIRIIREERERITLNFSPRFRTDFEKTGWIFSYLTHVKTISTLRLAIVHPDFGDDLGLYVENEPAIIFPVEADEPQTITLADFLSKKIKSTDEISDLQESIGYHSNMISNFIKVIQEYFPSVGPYCQVGAHTVEGLTGISSIMRGNERDVKFTLS